MDRRDLRERFDAEGYVGGLGVKTDAEADAVREQWDRLEAEEDMRRNGFNTAHSRHFDQRFVWDLASDPAILNYVEKLIGPDVLLFGTRFFCKYGPDNNFHVSWHQDLDSWGLRPPVALTVWYAIDRSDEENGCMQVIPGSHRAGLREHDTLNPPQGNLLGRGQHLDLGPTEMQRSQPVVLEPGQISIHHGALLHASYANSSTRRRCGLAIRYVPTHVRQDLALAKSPPSQAILVRGTDREKHFGVHPQPFA